MSGESVLAVPDERVIRDELQRLVLADLHGPLGGPAEEFPTRENPLDRYILGRLAPNGESIDPATQDAGADATVSDPMEGSAEPSAPSVPSLAPSALGFTAAVPVSVTELRVTAAWGSYETAAADREGPAGGRVWRRHQRGRAVTVALREGLIAPRSVDPAQPTVVVRGRARRLDGVWLVSLFLENRERSSSTREPARWIFQVELSATGPEQGVPVFVPRPEQVAGGDAADQAERLRLAMAYRFQPEFAVGHGTAVYAEPAQSDPLRAVTVGTATVPAHELPFTGVPDSEQDADLPELADVERDMKRLAELAEAGPVEALTGALRPLVTGYRAWIDRNEATAGDPARRLDAYPLQVRDAMREAREAADRIEAGITLLAADPKARAAFGFANRAMYLQRVHTVAAARRRKQPNTPLEQAVAAADQPAHHRWRPFQLAFVLINLPALADPRHPERGDDVNRAVTDLLWFPTGGGKTEAYLGLTAFTIAVRRRQPDYPGLTGGDGLAVLMRYTLRLLTIQQFERAATLICAAETLRRADPHTWGGTPIRIGLWVGGRVTPNRTQDAKDWLDERRRGRSNRGVGSPHQLTTCPWCGTRIEPGRDIVVEPDHWRTLVRCSDVECPFSAVGGYLLPVDEQGLPVLLVDE
ncbi:hypothetical protein ABZ671_11810 [Micromonospora sp. NPDC006766]|uniref:hypothetical protein n=1 Tax=Micromonospora sp. NPDC006766 TaxID=3154778 RepID=UPI0033EC4C18